MISQWKEKPKCHIKPKYNQRDEQLSIKITSYKPKYNEIIKKEAIKFEALKIKFDNRIEREERKLTCELQKQELPPQS